MGEEPREPFGGTLAAAFRSLPGLGDDLYLKMQGLNLSVVDAYLTDLELDLLRELHSLERTPMPSAVFVSALGQLWIFGVYELLRTWRQRVKEIRSFADECRKVSVSKRKELMGRKQAELKAKSPFPPDVAISQWPQYKKAATNEAFYQSLDSATDITLRLFRRVEALRVHLAKHEIPKSKGFPAMAPGYGRIHHETGSIYWQILLRDREVDVISRQDIANGCREFLNSTTRHFLPHQVRRQIRPLPQCAYGVKCVSVVLKDGSTVKEVFVAWDTEILAVHNLEEIPFAIKDITKILPCRAPFES